MKPAELLHQPEPCRLHRVGSLELCQHQIEAALVEITRDMRRASLAHDREEARWLLAEWFALSWAAEVRR